MSGNYEVFKAAARQGGVILAEKLEEFYDCLKVFSLLAKKQPQGSRIAAVFNAGFESTIVADELRRLQPARLAAHTLEKLRETDVHGLVDLSTALLDVTPMADDQLFTDYVEIVLQDQDVDCVLVSIVPTQRPEEQPSDCQIQTAWPLSWWNWAGSMKTLGCFVNGARHYDEFVKVLEEGGLPGVQEPQGSCAGVRNLCKFLPDIGYNKL